MTTNEKSPVASANANGAETEPTTKKDDHMNTTKSNPLTHEARDGLLARLAELERMQRVWLDDPFTVDSAGTRELVDATRAKGMHLEGRFTSEAARRLYRDKIYFPTTNIEWYGYKPEWAEPSQATLDVNDHLLEVQFNRKFSSGIELGTILTFDLFTGTADWETPSLLMPEEVEAIDLAAAVEFQAALAEAVEFMQAVVDDA
jgi:hypothetical protein